MQQNPVLTKDVHRNFSRSEKDDGNTAHGRNGTAYNESWIT